MSGGLPAGIRPPESELETFLRRMCVSPAEAYQLGRDAAQRECACGGVRRGGNAYSEAIERPGGYISRVY